MDANRSSKGHDAKGLKTTVSNSTVLAMQHQFFSGITVYAMLLPHFDMLPEIHTRRV